MKTENLLARITVRGFQLRMPLMPFIGAKLRCWGR